VANLKHEAEEQQLASIAGYIALESVKLASVTSQGNVTSTLRLNIPALIGNQRYWIQIQNDSSRAWVEVGFGSATLSNSRRLPIPLEVSASGTYVSGSGTAFIEYCLDSEGAHLTLFGGN